MKLIPLLLLIPTLAFGDSNSVIDFKGRLNWVNGNNVASYRIVLSDDFTDVTSTTTTEEPTTTTTLAPVTTTTSGPVTTTTVICGGGEDDDDDHHDGGDDHDSRATVAVATVDEFSLETSSGGAPMFDFRCALEARSGGKYKCSLPGVRVRIKPYKTPGTHTVKVRYTQSIVRPAAPPQVRVVARSTVFGRAFLDTSWAATANGYKVRAH